jgi:hypothetical protein
MNKWRRFGDGQFDWEDVVAWRQEVGLKKRIICEETGDISFDEWPTAPHP